MKKKELLALLFVLALIATAVVWRTVTPQVIADDGPVMGGANWDSDGVEWQMYTTYDTVTHEYWTYWMDGYGSYVIGDCTNHMPSTAPENEYPCEFEREGSTSRNVYSGRMVLSEDIDREARGFATDVRGPMDVWFYRETLEPIERYQLAGATIGAVDSGVWVDSMSGFETSRDLSGGESWSYNEYIEADCCACAADEGDTASNYSVSVADDPANRTVNGMTFSCYAVSRTEARGTITDYWDVDGVLAGPVETNDPVTYDNPQTFKLVYHEWPGEPVVYTCDSGGSPKTNFASSDHIYITGHWMTLNHANTLTPDVTYDIWVGQGIPSGNLTACGYTDTDIDANVGPQSGTNEPGSFGPIDLGTASSLGINGTGCYVVLDDDDGVYNGDTNTFEQATVPDWGWGVYEQGSSSSDDGVSIASFTVPPDTVDVDIYVTLQGENRPVTGWEIPLTVGFFEPGADVMNATPTYSFTGTTTMIVTSGTRAMLTVVGTVNPGTYDITADSPTTLLNVKRSVNIQ